MKTRLSILGLILISVAGTDCLAQAKPQDPTRTAVIETRLVRDSNGCPSAVDLWLGSTSDTIQGFEVVLQWDRPNTVQFVRGLNKATQPASGADSLTALLKPSDPKTQIPAERIGALISGWEFVEARSMDGHTAKVLGVAKLFGQNEPTPILPGASGALLRIPIVVKSADGAAADSVPVTLNFDVAGTRLSTHRGVLFGPLTLRSLALKSLVCDGKK
jgi:hypothetical protein